MFGSRMSYVKMEPDQYTNSRDRLIWIDSDTIVLGSLEPLWKMNLEGRVLAASRNPWGNPTNAHDRSPYLNTGVLLYDMQAWSKENLAKKLRQNAKVNLWGDHEQGAFNSVLVGRWKELDRRWNNCNTEDLSSKIIHFMSRPKPWETLGGNKLWLQMFEKTPFKDELIKTSNYPQWLAKSKLAYKFLSWQKEPWIRLQCYLKNRRRIKEAVQNNTSELPSTTSTTVRSPELAR